MNYEKLSKALEAIIERGCTFNEDGYAIDDCGNEYRDENGECIVLNDEEIKFLLKSVRGE